MSIWAIFKHLKFDVREIFVRKKSTNQRFIDIFVAPQADVWIFNVHSLKREEKRLEIVSHSPSSGLSFEKTLS